MVWYQRNYLNKFINFLIISLCLSFLSYFSGFFEQSRAVCMHYNSNCRSELLRLVLGDITILFSETLKESEVKLMFELYLDNFKKTELNNITNHNSFTVSKFMRTNSIYFSNQSPYSHFNISLNFYNNWKWNTGAYHQLTKFHSNMVYPINGFNFFNGTDLYSIYDHSKLISNNLRFYDHNILKPVIYDKKILNQLDLFKYTNQRDLYRHLKISLGIEENLINIYLRDF